MDTFFPFIHQKPKKQEEFEPLYLEIEEPQYQKIEKEMPEQEKEHSGIIIIQL